MIDSKDDTKALKHYEERIIVFIDILGFKEIVQSTIDKDGNEIPRQTAFVQKLLKIAEEIFDESPELCKSKVVTRFSDTIVVSFKYNEKSQVFYTLLDILHLHMNFLAHGVLVRGGVSFGKILHTNEMIFGPGLVTAYEFESKAAVFPRIVLSDEVIDLGAKHAIDGHSYDIEKEHLSDITVKDSDGHYYVDYFSKAHPELDEPDLEYPGYLDALAKIIIKGLTSTSPGVRNKFLWLRERYNAVVKHFRDPEFLKHIEENIDPEIADFYARLEEL